MSESMVFEDVHGLPIPRVPGIDENAPAEGDGVRFFDLEQAAGHFARTEAFLREMYAKSKSRPADAEAGPLPSDPAAAAVMRSVYDSRGESFRRAHYPHVSREHFRQFLDFCDARKLNPFCFHVYCSVRADPITGMPKMVPILGIEGARLLAHRTGEYAGNEVTIFEHDEYGNPVSATATAYRQRSGVETKDRYQAIVYMRDVYVASDERLQFYDQKPHAAMERPAEIAVLKKAFPQEFDGFNTSAEANEAYGPRQRQQPRWSRAGARAMNIPANESTRPVSEGQRFDPTTASQ